MADINVKVELKDGSKLTINKSAINSVSSLTQSNTDASTIFYGVVPSTGEIKISDKNGDIKNYVEDGLIDTSGVRVEVFANGNKVQSHITSNSSYQQQLLQTSLTDGLSSIANNVYSNPEQSNYLSAMTGLELLNHILAHIQPQIEIVLSDSINLPKNSTSFLTVEEYLNLIIFKDVDLAFDGLNFQEVLNRFCEATQLNLFSVDNSKYTLIPARPILSSFLNKKSILITYKDIFENEEPSIFLTNKVKQVGLNAKNIKVEKSTLMRFSSGTFPDMDTYVNDYSIFSGKFIYASSVYDKEYVDTYTDDNGNIWYIFMETFDTNEEYINGNFCYSYRYLDLTHKYVLGNYMHPVNSIDEFKNNLIKYLPNEPACCASFKTKINTDYVNKVTVLYGCKMTVDYNFSFRFWIGASETEDIIYNKKIITDTTMVFGNVNENLKSSEIINFEINPLLRSTSTINVYGEDVSLTEYIGNNICEDYSKGIKTKNVKVSCSDLYYTHNPELKAKDWSNGEILNVGDIVNLETDKNKDGSYINWKITGREFTFDGVPMLNLELQECLTKDKLY